MTELSDDEVKILREALDDEYRSYATYDQVINDFAPVAPFTNIREAEGRHIEALHNLFAAFNLPIPDNPWPGRVERYSSIEDACTAGVKAEIANGAMYDRLLRQTQNTDIIAVLENLQAASQQRHLPAFQRCVERSGAGGRQHHGRRLGRGRGRGNDCL